MIQFQYQTNNGPLLLTVPHSWQELSLEQMIAIESEDMQRDGLIKLFCILSGQDFQVVAESRDRKLYENIRLVCDFVATPPDFKALSLPKRLEIGGKIYDVPQNVNFIMHGQLELLQTIGAKNKILEDMPRVVAILMQPEMNGGKYDSLMVEEIEPLVRRARGLDCYAIVSFFLRKLGNFLPVGMTALRTYRKRTMRKETYYEDWLKPNALIVSEL